MWVFADERGRRVINEGSIWHGYNGVLHPYNWHLWSYEKKIREGLSYEVNPRLHGKLL